jgi:hypothetical protein
LFGAAHADAQFAPRAYFGTRTSVGQNAPQVVSPSFPVITAVPLAASEDEEYTELVVNPFTGREVQAPRCTDVWLNQNGIPHAYQHQFSRDQDVPTCVPPCQAIRAQLEYTQNATLRSQFQSELEEIGCTPTQAEYCQDVLTLYNEAAVAYGSSSDQAMHFSEQFEEGNCRREVTCDNDRVLCPEMRQDDANGNEYSQSDDTCEALPLFQQYQRVLAQIPQTTDLRLRRALTAQGSAIRAQLNQHTACRDYFGTGTTEVNLPSEPVEVAEPEPVVCETPELCAQYQAQIEQLEVQVSDMIRLLATMRETQAMMCQPGESRTGSPVYEQQGTGTNTLYQGRATDHNSSRSNTTSSRAQDWNSSRSNKTSEAEVPLSEVRRIILRR